MGVDVEITTGINHLDIEFVWRCLSQESYWARGRSLEDVQKSFQASLCFGLRDASTLETIGFCRVMTDYVAFAYLMDVFIVQVFRGKGFGSQLIDYVVNYPEIAHVKRFLLVTKDAHEFYRKFDFEHLEHPETFLIKSAN